MKYITTVCGKLDSSKVGFVNSHEHVYTYLAHPDGSYTYVITDIDKMEAELRELKEVGVDLLIDATGINMGRNPDFMRSMSINTGVNIVCTTGFYRDQFIPERIRKMSDDEVFNVVVNEVENGIEYTTVKPGMLKIGISKDRITDEEFRMARILAKVQQKTGLPLYVHCTDGTCAPEMARYLIGQGAIKEKVIMGHVDVPKDKEYLEELCGLGVNVSMDKFGRDVDSEDADRVEIVRYLVEKGLIGQILLGGDMGHPKYLRNFGGKPGYVYIKTKVVPHLMRVGLSESDIDKLFRENVIRLFAHE